jgi:membrane-bound lytic murein transglycosylase D
MPFFDSTDGFKIRQKPDYILNDKSRLIQKYIDSITLSTPPLTTAEEKTYTFSLFQSSGAKKKTIHLLYKTHGFNSSVKQKLHFFATKDRRTIYKRLSRAGRYVETMGNILIEKGLPHELVFLPLIESGFDPFAYSHKGAAGPWQFIPATARNHGLKIDWWVDERRDPVKSTIAASEYLKALYKRFGSWNLALAAYNSGEGRIGRALRRVKKKDYWTIRKTRYISRETKDYVPLFIASAAIAIDPESFGFRNINYHRPFKYDEVILNVPMDLKVVAGLTGVEASVIRELNPELRRGCTPPNVLRYTLRIPTGTKEIFLANLAGAREEENMFVKFYKVKSGDTVGKIAKRLGASIQAIIDINSLGREALIVAGKNLLIPFESGWDKRISKTVLGYNSSPGLSPQFKTHGL